MADARVDDVPLLLGLIITTLALGAIFVFARTITRSVIRPQFGWDDALIIVTWFIILGYNTAMFVSISRGYGKHVQDLTEEQYSSAIQAEVVGQFLAISSFPSGKASVAYLLQRIFPGKKLKWFMWTLVAGNAILFYGDAILILVQCQPVAFQWNHKIEGGTCWDPKVVIDWGFLTGIFGAVTDFAFAILPWFYISKLQMNLKEKISVGVALSMGLFAAVCSILKIYYTGTLGAHADYTFDTIPLVLWSCAELCAINIAACIPTLRPLYLWLIGKNPQGSTNTNPPYPAYAPRYGNSSGRLGRFSRRSAGETQQNSSGDHDRNIYHFRTYEVSVKNREDDRSWSQASTLDNRASSLGLTRPSSTCNFASRAE